MAKITKFKKIVPAIDQINRAFAKSSHFRHLLDNEFKLLKGMPETIPKIRILFADVENSLAPLQSSLGNLLHAHQKNFAPIAEMIEKQREQIEAFAKLATVVKKTMIPTPYSISALPHLHHRPPILPEPREELVIELSGEVIDELAEKIAEKVIEKLERRQALEEDWERDDDEGGPTVH